MILLLLIINTFFIFINAFSPCNYITVLSYGIDTVIANVTLNSSIVAEICGASFCGVSADNENPNLQPPPVERIYLISGIYLGCMILACLIIAFAVDSLSRYDNPAFIIHGYHVRHTVKYLYCIK